MRQPTDLMRSILTDETAQKIIDWIPPVYGDSYVGLWIIQAVGAAMGEIRDICEQLMYETSPATATLLLDQWEDQYALPRGSSLSIEQRRSRIAQKYLFRGPCNPATLAVAVSNALGGIEVDILENVAKNTFAVVCYEVVDDVSPAVEVLERIKPAHLLYEFRMAEPTATVARVGVGIAATQSEITTVEVHRK